MGIKAFNHGNDFVNKFVRAVVSDSTGLDAVTPAPPPVSGLTATGGFISDYTDGPAVYRAHIFTSSGTFNVTEPGDFGDTVDVLVVAGGGGGAPSPVSGSVSGGGGGGGGLVYKPGHPISTSPYTITVGGGGAPSALVGGFSAFDDDAASPFPASSLIAIGGGVGARGPNVTSGNEGGSGGGGDDGVAGSPGIQATSPNPRSIPADSVTYGFGNAGGAGDGSAPGYNGGGGGGAGGVGEDAPTPTTGAGGVGKQYLITGPPAATQPIGTPGPNPGGGYLAGGGSGGYRYTPRSVGTAGAGGGGAGDGAGNPGTPGTFSTGGGGGGSGNGGYGGSGGSGIVVVRYQIGQLTADTKATGGAISYYGGKTVHIFTTSGTFTTTEAIPSAQVIVVGGGGGGSLGGGGAGGIFYDTSFPMPAPTAYSVTVGAGGLSSYKPAGRFGGYAGNPSTFNPGPSVFTGLGGGGGGNDFPAGSNPNPGNGGDGGSGGGGGEDNGTAGSATQPGVTRPNIPTQIIYGTAGGDGRYRAGGGGGGADAAGETSPSPPSASPPSVGGAGGPGIGSPTIPWLPPAVSPDGYLGGGGGGAYTNDPPPGGAGGIGGGGPGGPITGDATPGTMNTGGGGGGTNNNPGAYKAGDGGSGIVLIAYPS
jgi:hypothetical protein